MRRAWIAVLLLAGCTGTMPADLGVRDGRLAPCPASPNCVCSFDSDAGHAIAPIGYHGPRDAAMARLKTVIAAMPRTKIVSERADYLHVEFTSLIFRFVDDVEFYLPADAPLIHVRSASRLGHSDFGVNRKRIEAVRTRFKDGE